MVDVNPPPRKTKMEQSLQAQIDIYVSHLSGLIARGRQLREAFAMNPADSSVMAATRAWQEDCGTTINQLSGGSKAHWLARAFSQAFLMRSATGDAVEGASAGEIVERLLDVLEQASASLTAEGNAPIMSSSPQGPEPRRFEFVHNAEIRPVIEQAYVDSRVAFDRGDYHEALRTSCGVLEAIVTDALEHKGQGCLSASGAPSGKIADWSFEMRLAVAEKAGLIRGGCARLPQVARKYRDHSDVTVSERDARQTGQVLHVIMRDLDPGR